MAWLVLITHQTQPEKKMLRFARNLPLGPQTAAKNRAGLRPAGLFGGKLF
jgi:hypothetical protein